MHPPPSHALYDLLRHYAERTIEPATALGWTKNASGHWQYYRDGRNLLRHDAVDTAAFARDTIQNPVLQSP